MKHIKSIYVGEAHLQNKVLKRECYICHAPVTENTVLLRKNDKEMVFACSDHEGIAREFFTQFKRFPLNWSLYDATKSRDQKVPGENNPV